MSQVEVLWEERATYVGRRTSFGVAPTYTRCFPIAGTGKPKPSVEQVENRDQRTNVFERLKTVRAYKRAKESLGYYAKMMAAANVMTAAGVLATAAQNPVGEFLYGLMGGIVVPAVGTTTTGTTIAGATSIIVTSASGLNKGTWIEVISDVGLEARFITNIAGTTVTLWPALVGATASGAAVRNMYGYFPAQANTQCLDVREALVGNANYQWQLKQGSGNWGVKIEPGKLIEFNFDLEFVDHDGPSALGYSVADAADSQIGPWMAKDMTVWLQPQATTTSVHVPIESMSIKVNNHMTMVKEFGGTQGVNGWARNGGRDYVEVDLKMRGDVDLDSVLYDPQASYRLVVAAPYSSGAGGQNFLFDLPNAYVLDKPDFDEGDKFAKGSIKLVGQRDTSVTSDTTDRGTAVCRVFYG